MPKEYTPEQLEQVFQKLPEELQETIFSVETAEHIQGALEPYGITDERAVRISQYVGHVLMGLLTPMEFQKVLMDDINLEETLTKAIFRQINRFVFYPVKPALDQLHEIATPKEKEVKASTIAPIKTQGEQEKKTKRKGPDKYRELVE